MVYVKRRDTFHVDSSPDLYGESQARVLDCGLLITALIPPCARRECRPPAHPPEPFASLSDPVQLLRRPLRLQPLPHGRAQVQLRVVRRRSARQLLVLRLLRRTCAADLPRPGHPLGTSLRCFKRLEAADKSSDRSRKLLGKTNRLSERPQIEPLTGLLEGGTTVTISGSNLGQKPEDILHSVTVAGIPCTVIPSLYEVSSR